MARLTLKDIKLDPRYFPFNGSRQNRELINGWAPKKQNWALTKNKLVDTVAQSCTIKDFRQDEDYHRKLDRDFINKIMYKGKQEDAEPFFCLDPAYADIL